MSSAQRLYAALRESSGGGPGGHEVTFTGERASRSAFAVTDFAAASIALAAASLVDLIEVAHPASSRITVDRELASGWFATTLRPLGWTAPPAWDALARDYEASDGWVRLHTNAPHHRRAALRALDLPADPAVVEREISRLQAGEVEARVVAAGG